MSVIIPIDHDPVGPANAEAPLVSREESVPAMGQIGCQIVEAKDKQTSWIYRWIYHQYDRWNDREDKLWLNRVTRAVNKSKTNERYRKKMYKRARYGEALGSAVFDNLNHVAPLGSTHEPGGYYASSHLSSDQAIQTNDASQFGFTPMSLSLASSQSEPIELEPGGLAEGLSPEDLPSAPPPFSSASHKPKTPTEASPSNPHEPVATPESGTGPIILDKSTYILRKLNEGEIAAYIRIENLVDLYKDTLSQFIVQEGQDQTARIGSMELNFLRSHLENNIADLGKTIREFQATGTFFPTPLIQNSHGQPLYNMESVYAARMAAENARDLLDETPDEVKSNFSATIKLPDSQPIRRQLTKGFREMDARDDEPGAPEPSKPEFRLFNRSPLRESLQPEPITNHPFSSDPRNTEPATQQQSAPANLTPPSGPHSQEPSLADATADDLDRLTWDGLVTNYHESFKALTLPERLARIDAEANDLNSIISTEQRAELIKLSFALSSEIRKLENTFRNRLAQVFALDDRPAMKLIAQDYLAQGFSLDQLEKILNQIKSKDHPIPSQLVPSQPTTQDPQGLSVDLRDFSSHGQTTPQDPVFSSTNPKSEEPSDAHPLPTSISRIPKPKTPIRPTAPISQNHYPQKTKPPVDRKRFIASAATSSYFLRSAASKLPANRLRSIPPSQLAKSSYQIFMTRK